MNEISRNIPEEAIQTVNASAQMRRLQRRERASVWGLRATGLVALYQIKDQAFTDISSVVLPFEDLRAYTIAVIAAAAFYASGSVRYHINKQKEAMRINEINRQLQAVSSQQLENYSPPILPENHTAQYADTARRLVGFAQRHLR